MIKLLDCTLRDGGYYNAWNFSSELVTDYLEAMDSLNVDFVEIGLRTLKNEGFKGGCAFSSEYFLSSLNIPKNLENKIGVMINGSEIVDKTTQIESLETLFNNSSDSIVSLVRIACHVHEFEACLPASKWLKDNGYLVGFNLMQVADRELEEITKLAKLASDYPIDSLYFADSMGSLSPEQVSLIVQALQAGWSGELGIHTHDNMGQAIANSLEAINGGVTWVDATVTGMGRGPGNGQTEYLSLAIEGLRAQTGNPTKLFEVIRKHFKPMQAKFGWGTNPYYYLAGKYGIHPTYIQEMLQDSRYSDEDIIAVINHLKVEGGKKFSLGTLESARHFYSGEPRGSWSPRNEIEGKSVLIIGAGPSIKDYQGLIENYIKTHKPYVIALNTQIDIDQSLINIRAACHPVRLLADCQEHLTLPQPLVTPLSMLPEDIKEALLSKDVLDFGLDVTPQTFSVSENYCVLPNSLVVTYALAIANSGGANNINLVGFDGFGAEDPRSSEMEQTLKIYLDANGLPLCSLTPTRYDIPTQSIFGL
ncbi:aldolase catalytic domain-containing protein [Aliiglaciecola aliphaticivorans]